MTVQYTLPRLRTQSISHLSALAKTLAIQLFGEVIQYLQDVRHAKRRDRSRLSFKTMLRVSLKCRSTERTQAEPDAYEPG